jgi:hypothetical protein
MRECGGTAQACDEILGFAARFAAEGSLQRRERPPQPPE